MIFDSPLLEILWLNGKNMKKSRRRKEKGQKEIANHQRNNSRQMIIEMHEWLRISHLSRLLLGGIVSCLTPYLPKHLLSR